MEILQHCGKQALIMLSTAVITVIILKAMLKRRRSCGYLIAAMAFKYLVHMVLIKEFLGAQYQNTAWWMGLNFTAVIFFLAFGFAVSFYVFEVSFLKLMVATGVSELVAMICMLVAATSINAVSGRGGGEINLLSLEWIDLLLPVWSILIFAVIYAIFRPLMLRFRDVQLKHPAIWYIVGGGYICSALMTNFPGSGENTDTLITFFVYPLTMFGVVLLILCLVVTYMFRRRAEMEHHYLEYSKKLMESQYLLVKKQIQRMDENRKLMDKNMAELLRIKQEGDQNLRIRNYIQTLEEEYAALNAGIYSNNWGLDALFCHEADICRESNITIDFLAQECSISREKEEYIFSVLLELLDFAVCENKKLKEEKRKIKLHLATVRGRMVIEFESGFRNSDRKEVAMLIKNLESMNIRITRQNREDAIHLILMN